MPDLTALLTRLSGATEGSRELDAEIWLATTDVVSSSQYSDWLELRPKGEKPKTTPRVQFARFYALNYTTSLDAALTLVPTKPEEMGWSVNGSGDAEVYYYGMNRQAFQGDASTPPLALCIACLKARQQSDA